MNSIQQITKSVLDEIVSIILERSNRNSMDISLPVEKQEYYDEYTDFQLYLSSVEFIKLLVQLETYFSIEFSDDELDMSVFKNVNIMSKFIYKKLTKQEENVVTNKIEPPVFEIVEETTEDVILFHSKLNSDIIETFSKQAWLINESIIDIKATDQYIRIKTKGLVKNDLQNLHKNLKKMLEKLINNNRKNKTIYRFPLQNHMYQKNIMDELLRMKAVMRYSSGRYGYSGIFLDVMQWFDQQFLRFSREYNSINMQFPVTMDFDALNRCQYTAEFPNNLVFLSTLPRNIDVYIEYSVNTSKNPVNLQGTDLLFSPTVCIHLYEALKGTHLHDAFCATALGKCYRNEYILEDNLERLNEFSMREIIMIGTESQVLSFRNHIMEKTKELAMQLGLEGQIKVASDPFFTSKNIDNIFFQKLYELKYEIDLNVASDHDITVGSFNLHGRHFTDAFQISGDAELQSGCCAYGLERWAYAYFSQYGNNLNALIKFEAMENNETK